jgi:hypothetical protein
MGSKRSGLPKTRAFTGRFVSTKSTLEYEGCFFRGDEMSLIEKIFAATQSGDLPHRFTVDSLKDWIKKMQIVKDNGNPYAQSSIDAILSNSDTKNTPTSNKNRKVLQSDIKNGVKHEYWF